MRTMHWIATLGIGTAMAIGAVAGTASASSPHPHGVGPDYVGCTFTIAGPATLYADASFNHPIGGKHTGAKVTSEDYCPYFQEGFHDVRLSAGGTGYFYASNLVKPAPFPTVESRYLISGTVNVRTGPSTTRGAVIGQKTRGQMVTSPLGKDDFSNNGFAEVLLSSGNLGWISSAYLQ